ncbi:MAG: NUDIX hydrolase [Bacteroidota bacterium]|nr:NUDIX hydrolase [Bacteroidota bacterium]
MKLFINDIPVHIKALDQVFSPIDYDIIIDGPKEEILLEKLVDYVLIKDASPQQIEQTFKFMKIKKLRKLDEVTFSVQDKEATIKNIKNKFTIIKAAGGVVDKDDKILMIHRLGKWDLPKGKLDKKEKTKDAAIREVEEECNIKVILSGKICSTWHTYTQNGKGILKKTSWYAMECVDDKDMKPQKEEDIEEVRWMDGRELRPALYNSYRSVRHVFNEYFKSKNKIS